MQQILFNTYTFFKRKDNIPLFKYSWVFNFIFYIVNVQLFKLWVLLFGTFMFVFSNLLCNDKEGKGIIIE